MPQTLCAWGVGFRVCGSGFEVWGSRVYAAGYRICGSGLGIRVWGLANLIGARREDAFHVNALLLFLQLTLALHMVTLRSKFRTNEARVLHRVGLRTSYKPR